jgi:uncharacterized membrane protein YvbJ
MFCPQCGLQIGTNDKFCGRCGNLLHKLPGDVQPPQGTATRPPMEGKLELFFNSKRKLLFIIGLVALTLLGAAKAWNGC